MTKQNVRKSIFLIISTIMIFVIMIGISGCKFVFDNDNNKPDDKGNSDDVNNDPSDDLSTLTKIDFQEGFSGKVNQWSETLGVVERNIQKVSSNEGLCERYPIYGTSLPDITAEEKSQLLQETSLMFASDSTYDAMDEKGNYLLNGQLTGKSLYKHTSAEGMYYGNVSDDEKGVVERITIRAKEVRNYVTGLYAPAGEVVKIEISEEDLASIGGSLLVVVGQVSHRNVVNNIWAARDDFSRMPIIANKMTVTTTTSYVGNPLGGPIYIYPTNFDTTFTVTISGAVKYAHFIYGQTTAEEVEEMKSYSAPYFDYEIWDLGVRHSGPKSYANFDYDNLVKCGDLWEKITRTSRQVPCSANVSIGVGYVYDCFVAAGAAVAFQGGHSWVNAPCSWLSGALNYDSMVTDGFWGLIHEYNHLYQSYGMENSKTNEVTNNATSLLSYVLYTKISENRSLNDSTLSGWNRYTDPSRSLRETVANQESGEPQNALNVYADLIHTFGTDIFTKAARTQKKLGVDGWYEALSLVTDYNFTYYFENILNQTLSEEVKALYDTSDRINYIPIACIYQTGRSYYDGKSEVFSETVKPYLIERGEQVTMDFNERLIVPNGYSFKIKSVSLPANGTLERVEENVYRYTPDNNEYSGVMKLVVGLEGEKETKDITLTIEFRQYYKNQVEVTKYKYEGDTKYIGVDEAVANNFVGFTDKNTYKNTSTFINGLANNQIGVVEGKIYIAESGDYALCLRSGRGNNTLYLGVNTSKLEQVLSLNSDHPYFALEGEHVVNLSLNEGDYLYFKEITLSRHYQDAYTELGMAKLGEGATMKTVATAYLCTNDMLIEKEEFVSQEKYPRTYTTAKDVTSTTSGSHNLIEANMGSWSEGEGIENIFDGNPNTFYHNERNNFLSEENPFILVADMGEAGIYNSIKIVSRTSGQYNLPITFKLYGSLDNNEWFTLGEYKELGLNGNTVTANFNATEFRYYKLYVTDTKAQSSTNKYITIARIDFSYTISGNEYSPYALNYYKDDNSNFVESKEPSEFGRTIYGNGTITYSYKGGFALLVNQHEDCRIKVTLNGNEYEYYLSENEDSYIAFYINSKDFAEVTIEVIEGNINVDSVIVENNEE